FGNEAFVVVGNYYGVTDRIARRYVIIQPGGGASIDRSTTAFINTGDQLRTRYDSAFTLRPPIFFGYNAIGMHRGRAKQLECLLTCIVLTADAAEEHLRS